MLASRPPTPRQLAVLHYLQDCRARSQIPPSRKEMALHFGIAPNAVERHLLALERRGMIQRERGRHRALRLTGAL